MAANGNSVNFVKHQTFDGRGFTDYNSLANAILQKPDHLDGVLTYLLGRESDAFPLSFLTEGQTALKQETPIQNIEYSWDVMEGHLDRPDEVISHGYTAGDKPGLGRAPFYVTMRTNWLKNGHMVETPNESQVVVVNHVPDGNGYHLYTFKMADGFADSYMDLSQLLHGTKWAMVGGAPVTNSRSFGNESNVVMPGRIKNQISVLRKSYEIAGNISDQVVEVTFNIDGKTTNMWMAWEEWQHLRSWKTSVEEHLWFARYNRDASGRIGLLDDTNGQEIPIGAGLIDQIPNSDTFSVLTEAKVKKVVSDALYGAQDTEMMNLVLYTGLGGEEDFDTAMKASLSSLNFTISDQDKFVSGQREALSYGGYFKQYRHVNGHLITIKRLGLLDYSARAQKAPKHPNSGKPLTSHDMYFVDMSVYDGVPNISMVPQKGRSLITGVLPGMAKLPSLDFKGNNTSIRQLATSQDISSVHYMCAKGIRVRRNTHCFKLLCTAS